MGHRKEQKTEHKEHKMTIKTEANNESIFSRREIKNEYSL